MLFLVHWLNRIERSKPRAVDKKVVEVALCVVIQL
jgi:hypothetical protein